MKNIMKKIRYWLRLMWGLLGLMLDLLAIFGAAPTLMRSAYWQMSRTAPIPTSDTNARVMMSIMIISTMMRDPKFKARCHRRQWLFWKRQLRLNCISINQPYTYRLQLIGWNYNK